ncbi:HNH endonuclease [Nocardiopsis sp. CNR-923]|uniref:HNH endonuclease n=1 Tax=Nocardiopsis sp. CNR-923 TaxID=1904965 RepID=UPI00096A9628|nr:HNH endonuclease signature motif containing protein [Nocardiopsis sp. CNR-923]
MPGWQNSTRRATLPPDWDRAIRPRILNRDNHRCHWRVGDGICGRPATDVDHIDGRDDHRDENLQSLCRTHHRRKSSGEGGRARWAKRPSRYRPKPPHPGLL